jgi:hypothetical protein
MPSIKPKKISSLPKFYLGLYEKGKKLNPLDYEKFSKIHRIKISYTKKGGGYKDLRPPVLYKLLRLSFADAFKAEVDRLRFAEELSGQELLETARKNLLDWGIGHKKKKKKK